MLLRAVGLTLFSFLCADVVVASPWGIGYERQAWNQVSLQPLYAPETRPNRGPHFSKPGYEFSMPEITKYYLDEPGLIFGLIGGMGETESNRLRARRDAIRDRELTYTWAMGSPPPIPLNRWNRWSIAEGKAKGAWVDYASHPAPPGGQRRYFDPNLNIEYSRINADFISPPQTLDHGFYWMPSAEIGIMALHVYGPNEKKGAANDIGLLSFPVNLHVGWRPEFLPWLSVEGKGGWDFIIWGLMALVSEGGLKDYQQAYNYGGKAALGFNWLEVYYDWNYRAENAPESLGYSRSYTGQISSIGARLDVGVLIYSMFFDN